MVEMLISLFLTTEPGRLPEHCHEVLDLQQKNVISTPPFIFTKRNQTSQKYALILITQEITRLRLLVNEFLNLPFLFFFLTNGDYLSWLSFKIWFFKKPIYPIIGGKWAVSLVLQKIKIKTTIRYHYIPSRIGKKIKETNNTQDCQGYEQWKFTYPIHDTGFPPYIYIQKKRGHISTKDSYQNVHSSTIQNSQKLQTQNRMDKL